MGSKGPSSSAADEVRHVMSSTKELTRLLAGHQMQLSLMVESMRAVGTARFRYSATQTQWTDAELEELFKIWMQAERAAWKLRSIRPFSTALRPRWSSVRAPARSPHPGTLHA